jgi:hypothetical protein
MIVGGAIQTSYSMIVGIMSKGRNHCGEEFVLPSGAMIKKWRRDNKYCH